MSKKLLIVYRIEIAVIIMLVITLVTGTLIHFIRQADSGNRAERQSGTFDSGGMSVFTGIGNLRIPAADSSSTIMLSISFPYSADDRPFAEELASRIGEFRSITTGYFSSLSSENLARLNEDAAKVEILGRYNAILRLGKIETLYFTDFRIFD